MLVYMVNSIYLCGPVHIDAYSIRGSPSNWKMLKIFFGEVYTKNIHTVKCPFKVLWKIFHEISFYTIA